MRVLCFRYCGRVGHFLRAEMNASALSYPVPPRTALLGLLGAILGLSKDTASGVLADAQIGVAGAVPNRHYHTANVRKRTGLTDILSPRLRPARSGEALPDVTGGGAASQVVQEWLLKPKFLIYVGSADSQPWMNELCRRFDSPAVQTHFTPSLGLASMLAHLTRVDLAEAEPLDLGRHLASTLCRKSEGTLPSLKELEGLEVQELRMPRSVTEDRVFTQENYYLEMKGQPLPFETAGAWKFQNRVITFL